jgi:hypothetical protein
MPKSRKRPKAVLKRKARDRAVVVQRQPLDDQFVYRDDAADAALTGRGWKSWGDEPGGDGGDDWEWEPSEPGVVDAVPTSIYCREYGLLVEYASMAYPAPTETFDDLASLLREIDRIEAYRAAASPPIQPVPPSADGL